MRTHCACLWQLIFTTACFAEPERVSSTTGATLTTTEPAEESSSSTDAESSSSEGETSSSGAPIDPYACPEWCNAFECDTVLLFERCRCTNDAICELGGLQCHVPEGGGVGHCY